MYTLIGILFAIFHIVAIVMCFTTTNIDEKLTILILQFIVLGIQLFTLSYIKELKNKIQNKKEN